MLLGNGMKLIIKYIWSIAIIPFLVFLKGDLSVDTFMRLNNIESIAKTKEKVMNKFQPKANTLYMIPVKVVSNNPAFSADGLKVDLYNSEFNLVEHTQVLNGMVCISSASVADTGSYHLIVASTADELKFKPSTTNAPLTIHEDHQDL
jgi:hypothetical protein